MNKSVAEYLLQDSGNDEFYTPHEIVESARTVLGSIELDPSSCEEANRTVLAHRIFTKDDDGLSQKWVADTVWMNHPFSRINNKLWTQKLVDEYQSGNVNEAVMICFASTSESWFQKLYEFPICFLNKRTNFSGKKSPTKGCAVIYLGGNTQAFVDEFSKHGSVMQRLREAS
ncbi:DNA N-6-adenine-methyltransferase [Enterovibrio baiacu]|uniref:DNA N-6-adenine-methyltransferase n=1 Tax=Enterovibrio baiacu TaxID=2491023 RepID=UPI00101235F9|nr:DNA N-6-adenine-methyltransferase [Enterovibrio baiacu]MBE1275092.1 hypothetical protein [Enterovibrio baiacu]